LAAPASTDSPNPPHPWRARQARGLLAFVGWRVIFNGVPAPKGIVIVYPHTSNWDFVLGLLAKWAVDLPVRWVGKETLFRGLIGATLGRLMRRWGGRPVDRHHPSGAVEQLAQWMAAEPWFWLGLSPEGTRRHQTFIRSGFYHLALRTGVPVILATIDYARREIAATEVAQMTGDVERDLARLRAYYADKRGRYPHQASTIAFKEDD
jgi:1-acyl-sn-glycerol-3-phosphate acyltransferase